MRALLIVNLLLLSSVLAAAQQPRPSSPKRMIDRCAQDGIQFRGYDNSIFRQNDEPRSGKPVRVERDGVGLTITSAPKRTRFLFTRGGTNLVVTVTGMDPSLAYLTVSAHGVALSTSDNAHDWSTMLLTSGPGRELRRSQGLVHEAEKTFERDARRFCRWPGVETSAIKWLDDDRLLIAIDAWGDGSCSSNFTEGFVLNVTEDRVERKLSNQQLIDLPAVCTWNLVPVEKH